MKNPNRIFLSLLSAVLVFGAAWTPQPVPAASVYNKPFDSQATVKVLVNKLANAELAHVDYAALLRAQSGGGGQATFGIPEAPNKIPGTAPRRGVLLKATNGGTRPQFSPFPVPPMPSPVKANSFQKHLPFSSIDFTASTLGRPPLFSRFRSLIQRHPEKANIYQSRKRSIFTPHSSKYYQ